MAEETKRPVGRPRKDLLGSDVKVSKVWLRLPKDVNDRLRILYHVDRHIKKGMDGISWNGYLNYLLGMVVEERNEEIDRLLTRMEQRRKMEQK